MRSLHARSGRELQQAGVKRHQALRHRLDAQVGNRPAGLVPHGCGDARSGKFRDTLAQCFNVQRIADRTVPAGRDQFGSAALLADDGRQAAGERFQHGV